MQVRLEVTHKKANVRNVVLHSDTVIGRSSDCQLRIASSEVSRKHCKITLNGDSVFVRDLKSSNGTFVNGVPIPVDRDMPLRSGSKLAVGPVKFLVNFEATEIAKSGKGSNIDMVPAGRSTVSESKDSGFLNADAEELEMEELELESSDDSADESESVLDSDSFFELDDDDDDSRVGAVDGARQNQGDSSMLNSRDSILGFRRPDQPRPDGGSDTFESYKDVGDLDNPGLSESDTVRGFDAGTSTISEGPLVDFGDDTDTNVEWGNDDDSPAPPGSQNNADAPENSDQTDDDDDNDGLSDFLNQFD